MTGNQEMARHRKYTTPKDCVHGNKGREANRQNLLEKHGDMEQLSAANLTDLEQQTEKPALTARVKGHPKL